MTTANLSVNIDTKQAFDSLLKLRQEMQNQPHNLVLNIDGGSVERQIQGYLRRKYIINVDTAKMGAEIQNDVDAALQRAFDKPGRKLSWNVASLQGGLNSAVDTAFNDTGRRLRFDRNRLAEELEASVAGVLGVEHHVRIKKEALTLAVREAVSEGLAGGVVHLGGVAGHQGAAGGLGPDLTTTLQRTLAPAVDALTTAANQIASVARKVGVSQPAGDLTAKESLSVKDPATGYTKSVSRKLPDATAVEKDIMFVRDATASVKAEADLAAEAYKVSQALDAQKLSEIGVAEAQAKSMEMTNQLGQRAQAFQRMRAQSAGSQLQETEEYKMGLKAKTQAEALELLNQTGQRAQAFQRMRAQAAGSQLQETEEYKMGLKAKTQSESMELLNQTGQRAQAFQRMRAQASGSQLQETEEYKMGLKAKTQAEALEMLNQTGQRQTAAQRMKAQAAGDQLKELEEYRAGLKAKTDALVAFYAEQRFIAAQSYKGAGPDIIAARATAANPQFGQAKTSAYLGPTQQHLLDPSIDVEGYRHALTGVNPAIAAAKAEQARLNEALKDGQSATRGLASGFGAMGLTLGSVIPLLAGAAISHSFMEAVKAGSEVGQQLTIIKYQGGEATAEIDALNKALLDTAHNGPFGPQEVAKAMKTMELAGLSAKQQLDGLQAVMNFSMVGEVNVEKSAETLVALATAFGYTAKDFNVVGDVITKAAAVSMTSVESLMGSMKTASTVAQEFKISIADVGTGLALLSNIGIKGTAAGTSLRQMYSELAGTATKARRVLEDSLQVDLFDKVTGRMKPLAESIGLVSAALDKYGPRSQLMLEQALGSEKGTKGLIAVIEAYRTKVVEVGGTATTELARIQKLMEDAPGFMAEAAIGMSLSAQNQMKSVSAALEGSLVGAFQKIEPSVLAVSSKLRTMFASDEFKNGIANTITSVANFTTALVNHAGVISEAVKAYIAWKVVTLSFTSLSAVTSLVTTLGTAFARTGVSATVAALGTGGLNAMLAATPAVATTATVAVARLQLAMGWIAVIGTVLAGAITMWTLYADKSVDASVRSSEAARAASVSTAQSMDAEIDRLTKMIAERKRGTEETLIAGALQTQASIENIHNSYAEEQALLRVALAQAKANDAKGNGRTVTTRHGQTGVTRESVAQSALDLSMSNEAKEVAAAQARHDKMAALSKQNADEAAAAAAEHAKHPSGDLVFDPDAAAKAAAAHTLEMAQMRQEIDLLKEKRTEEESYAKFKAQLNDARFNPALFGPYVAAALAEQRMIAETTRLVAAQKSTVQALEEMRSRSNLKAPDRVNLQTEIQQENARYDKDILALKRAKEIAEATESARVQEGKNAQRKIDDDLALKYNDVLNVENTRGHATKKSDPRDAAGAKAVAEINAIGEEKLQAQQDRVNTGLANENLLLTQRALILSDPNAYHVVGDLAEIDASIAAVKEQNSVEAKVFAERKARLEAAKTQASDVAKANYDASQTAGAGWAKFWEEYVTKADSAAKQVEDILKSTTDNITKTVEKLATTGKWNWRPIADGLLSSSSKSLVDSGMGAVSKLFTPTKVAGTATDLTKDAAAASAKTLSTSLATLDASAVDLNALGFKPLTTSFTEFMASLNSTSLALERLQMSAGSGGSGVSGLGGLFSGGGSSGAGAASSGSAAYAGETGLTSMDVVGTGFAKGGIMTPYGPMSLRTYSDGGVARGPQVSVHGEGSLPEANVPLQDGRSIPVTINGAAGGGNSVSLSYSPIIHIDSRTDQTQVVQLVSRAVQQGNKQMLQHLKDTGAIS